MKKIGEKNFASKNKKMGKKFMKIFASKNKKKKQCCYLGARGVAAAGGERPGEDPAAAGESPRCRLPRRTQSFAPRKPTAALLAPDGGSR